jgi:hypothetical protein
MGETKETITKVDSMKQYFNPRIKCPFSQFKAHSLPSYPPPLLIFATTILYIKNENN